MVDLLGTTAEGRDLVRRSYDVQPYELPGAAEGEAATKWIHVLPLGQVDARDGRSFRVENAADILKLCELPMLVDWEHQSEFWNGSTEAAGWIEEFAVEPGGSGRFPSAGIWGRVEWTPEGQKDVDGKAYRYLSPVLLLEVPPLPAGTATAERSAFEARTVLQIVSVALTNTPALRMQSIDSFRERLSARFGPLDQEKTNMDPEKRKALCAALGLAATATDDEMVAASSNRPAPEKALLSTLTNQVTELTNENAQLKTKLADGEKAAFAAEVSAVLDQASKDGKIPPAARAGYEAICASREGFATFTTSILPNLVAIGGKAPASPKTPAPKSAEADQVVVRLRKRGVDEKTEAAARELIANKRGARPNMED
jgi:phage I-like protein